MSDAEDAPTIDDATEMLRLVLAGVLALAATRALSATAPAPEPRDETGPMGRDDGDEPADTLDALDDALRSFRERYGPARLAEELSGWLILYAQEFHAESMAFQVGYGTVRVTTSTLRAPGDTNPKGTR